MPPTPTTWTGVLLIRGRSVPELALVAPAPAVDPAREKEAQKDRSRPLLATDATPPRVPVPPTPSTWTGVALLKSSVA